MPKVSVVIPTIRRPQIVLVAIRSVLDQTLSDFEVIVVVDGPDPLTECALAEITDPRVRVVVNPQNVGLAEARNIGVRHAAAAWIAFLDDDDEWLPAKLERQLEVAGAFAADYVFVCSRFIELTETMQRVLPQRLPIPLQDISEYLYVQRGFFLPSTFFASRKLMEQVPFTSGLRQIEDIDWILRVANFPGLKIGAVSEALVLYNDANVQGRESNNVPWLSWHNWLLAHRELLTPKAFSLFIAKHCVGAARGRREKLSVFLYLFATAVMLGAISFDFFVAFFSWSLFPPHVRRKVLRLVSRSARKNTTLVNSKA